MKAKGRKKPRKSKPAPASQLDLNVTQWVELPDKTRVFVVVPTGPKGPRQGKKDFEYARDPLLKVKGERSYEILRLLARGGMGVVCEARDVQCGRVVAMKLLMESNPHQPDDHLRFLHEARITSQLEHPNIVPVHEFGDDTRGNNFYTMKFVRGVTLTDVLTEIRNGNAEYIEQYPLSHLLTIFQKVCDAVAFAHSRGIIHRDLKPGNIMIGDFGEVLVVDWGLAKILKEPEGAPAATAPACKRRGGPEAAEPPAQPDDDTGEFPTISLSTDKLGAGLQSESGKIIGTPSFMSPEQTRGQAGLVDTRTDIYSLGAILYSILTLRAPITGTDIKDVLRKIVAGDILPPVAYNNPKATAEDGRSIALPHCPDGQVPRMLSDICMKALSTAASERYPGVRALQQDVEDYQNGLTWHLVIDEDFSGPDFFSRWQVVGGRCELHDGELRHHGGELQMLLLKWDLPQDVRIEFECREEGAYLNDVGCILSAIRSPNDWETSVSGYAFKYGAYTNTLNVLTRCDKRIWSAKDSPLVSGRPVKVLAERVGNRLRMVVDNREICNVVDPDPLAGSNRTLVGLIGWIADQRYTRIRVYSLGTPWKSDLLDVAERHLQRANYATAMDLFRDVMTSFPDAARLERADRGFHAARDRDAMVRNLPLWLQRFERAWPGANVQTRIDHDGLTVEIPPVGIDDLTPLTGIPITTLICWGNRIRSLEPLRGMPLAVLNCVGNPVEDLEPLRGMPLNTLRCEGCSIRSLKPLRGMPLAVLNVSENPIEDGIDVLGTLKQLTWLACVKCGLESVECLRGLSLNTLFIDANRIRDLGPLSGMPIVELSFGGNRVDTLEPLRGMPLNTLHCRDNRIASLDPLRGLPISTFRCQANTIRNLDAIEGMPLSSLMCGANELRGLGPMLARPPKTFAFECDTLPLEELEWIQRKWARDFRMAEHARAAECLLALRRDDRKKLKSLASGLRGHLYLAIPRFVRWDEARDLCERLGGHLACITSEEENNIVASLFPFGGSWAWIGLQVDDEGRQRWVTGEPFTFNGFSSVLQERMPGPRVLSGHNWCYDVVPDAHNSFVIEWTA